MGRAVFECTLQLQHDIAGAVTLEPFIGDRRAGDIAAEMLQLLALIGAPAHRRMEAEACRCRARGRDRAGAARALHDGRVRRGPCRLLRLQSGSDGGAGSRHLDYVALLIEQVSASAAPSLAAPCSARSTPPHRGTDRAALRLPARSPRTESTRHPRRWGGRARATCGL